jgi:hypothetical protein
MLVSAAEAFNRRVKELCNRPEFPGLECVSPDNRSLTTGD